MDMMLNATEEVERVFVTTWVCSDRTAPSVISITPTWEMQTTSVTVSLPFTSENTSHCFSHLPIDKMSVGFVYTFGVTELRERESFYLAVPEDDVTLKFEFEIATNLNDRDVIVQLFLGKGESLLHELARCASIKWRSSSSQSRRDFGSWLT